MPDRAAAVSVWDRQRVGAVMLRVAVATLLLVHGVARVALGIVDDFGAFLSESSVPLGPVVAWTITAVEIGGGAALALGRFVRPLAAWFAVELMVGIVLVHAPEGWFVVGAGRNGMEYSVLLIVALAATALLHAPRAPGTPDDAPSG